VRLRRRRARTADDEITAAREATEESASQAASDVEAQQQRLDWERRVLTPAFRRLHERNHVADAIVKIIESSEK
jgi:hypothetical protein